MCLLPLAQLLRQSDHNGRTEEGGDLLQASHSNGRGNNVRLQVPVRGGQDSLSLSVSSLSPLPQLKTKFDILHTHTCPFMLHLNIEQKCYLYLFSVYEFMPCLIFTFIALHVSCILI